VFRRPLTGFLAAAALAAAVAVPSAMSRAPVEPSRAPCPTGGALVVYYVNQGVAYKDNLVIEPDGRAALCWGRARPGAVTGRTTFAVANGTMKLLQAALDGIDVEHLGPPPAQWPPCCLKRATILVYRGFGVPYHGQPRTPAGLESLHRAQSILEAIIDRHDPEL
jgi:hypothetical protein